MLPLIFFIRISLDNKENSSLVRIITRKVICDLIHIKVDFDLLHACMLKYQKLHKQAVIKLVWHNHAHRIENNAINNRYKATEANQLKSLSIFIIFFVPREERKEMKRESICCCFLSLFSLSRPLSRFIASEKKEKRENIIQN